jgi:hypothetical protein
MKVLSPSPFCAAARMVCEIIATLLMCYIIGLGSTL